MKDLITRLARLSDWLPALSFTGSMPARNNYLYGLNIVVLGLRVCPCVICIGNNDLIIIKIKREVSYINW